MRRLDAFLNCPFFEETLAHIERTMRKGRKSLQVVLYSIAHAAMRRKPRGIVPSLSCAVPDRK